MRIRGTARESREQAASRAHATENATSPLSALQRLADDSAAVQRLAVIQEKGREAEASDRGGLPPRLRMGVEALSGHDMSDVKVHYNSPKPATLQAHAYAQGRDIHVAPGQEQHLAHEAWHVVQQGQGRVRATMDMAGTAVNDDPALEAEADSMGARAMSAQPATGVSQREGIADGALQRVVAQLNGVFLTAKRRTHILDGDGTGGGHRSGTGKPGKSEFPEDWSDSDIEDALYDVAESGAYMGAGNIPNSEVLQKRVNGVTVKVVVGSNGSIITGFPLSGQGVVKNPW
jgi:hypothetical protein